MSWKVCLASFIALAVLSLPTRASPPETRPVTGAVKITIKEFEDERALVREPLSERIHVPWSPHILMELKLEGDAIRNASRMSDPKITEAVDDLGNSLLSSSEQEKREWAHPVDSRGNPLSIRAPEFWGPDTQPAAAEEMKATWRRDDDKAAMDMYLRLNSPIRRATKIARLRASVRVMAGGQRQRIEISNLPALIDHELIHPVLKQAGMHIRFLSHPPYQGDPPLTSFALKAPGEMAQIRSVAIFEGSNDISHDNGGPDNDTWVISLNRSLTAAMVLKLDVVYGQKVVTVPLELNDVRLP